MRRVARGHATSTGTSAGNGGRSPSRAPAPLPDDGGWVQGGTVLGRSRGPGHARRGRTPQTRSDSIAWRARAREVAERRQPTSSARSAQPLRPLECGQRDRGQRGALAAGDDHVERGPHSRLYAQRRAGRRRSRRGLESDQAGLTAEARPSVSSSPNSRVRPRDQVNAPWRDVLDPRRHGQAGVEQRVVAAASASKRPAAHEPVGSAPAPRHRSGRAGSPRRGPRAWPPPPCSPVARQSPRPGEAPEAAARSVPGPPPRSLARARHARRSRRPPHRVEHAEEGARCLRTSSNPVRIRRADGACPAPAQASRSRRIGPTASRAPHDAPGADDERATPSGERRGERKRRRERVGAVSRPRRGRPGRTPDSGPGDRRP